MDPEHDEAASHCVSLAYFASRPVKLNVGGSYFATSLETLTREPGTFFSVLLSGRWGVQLNPDDKAIFIDRDPTLFPAILDYLRTGAITVDHMRENELALLRREVDFYVISPLMAMLTGPVWFARHAIGAISFSELDSVATSEPGRGSRVASKAVYSPTTREMSIKIITGSRILVGVAPTILGSVCADGDRLGWHMFAENGMLHGADGKSNVVYGKPIKPGSIVTVRLDEEFNITFIVDGEDWGMAYEKVATGFTTTPLRLVAEFNLDLEAHEVMEAAVKLMA